MHQSHEGLDLVIGFEEKHLAAQLSCGDVVADEYSNGRAVEPSDTGDIQDRVDPLLADQPTQSPFQLVARLALDDASSDLDYRLFAVRTYLDLHGNGPLVSSERPSGR